MFKLPIICGIIVLAVAAMGYEYTSTIVVNDSRDNFIKIDNNYYLIVEREFNWFDAAHFCRAINADLAYIQSAEELDSLSDYLISTGKNETYSIDGTDLGKEGSFFSWVTGLPMKFLKWAEGQPNNLEENQHCMNIIIEKDTFKMNDFDCNAKGYFICKARNERTFKICSP